MTSTNSFELSIPTHIEFTLYTSDEFDAIIIDTLTKNQLIPNRENTSVIRADLFLQAIESNKVSYKEFKST